MQRLLKQHQMQSDKVSQMNKDFMRTNNLQSKSLNDKDLEIKRLTDELNISKAKNKEIRV